MPYPERQPAPEGGPDRLLAGLGFRFHSIAARRLGNAAPLAAQVRAGAARLRGQALAALLPALRYRLRRHGFLPALLQDCFSLYVAALPERSAGELSPRVLAAARWLVAGGIAELADPGERAQAIALAGFARAVQGAPVHFVTASDGAAQALCESLRGPFAALAMDVGRVAQGADAQARQAAYRCPVACVPYREVGLDYLRDRVQSGGRAGATRGRVERIAAGHEARQKLLLSGLHCALVLDADRVMLDEARTPLVIAREVDQSQERLMYEQAIELARALQPGSDFGVKEGELRLADEAAGLLDRLVTPLGGVWAARERREELVRLALEVLHVLQREVDYRVDDGRVLLPERPADAAEAHAARDGALKMLIEVKEGCRTSPRRELVARVSLPAFLSRYLHLGGVCADARGTEGELWALYGLKTAAAGRRAPDIAWSPRVFATSAAKHAAVADRLRKTALAGRAALVAVRSQDEAKAVREAIAAAGTEAAAITVHPAQAPLPLAAAERPLTLLVSELHDAKRHLADLYATYRASSAEVLLALEDERIAAAMDATVLSAVKRLAGPDGELRPWTARLVARLAQRGAERSLALLRLEVLSRDQQQSDLLAFAGEGD